MFQQSGVAPDLLPANGNINEMYQDSSRVHTPIMQELLRLQTFGLLNPIQAQWFRSSKTAEELFDTYTDPYELHNLASDLRYRAKLIELRNECNRWMNAIEDKGRIIEREYIKSIWNGDQQPITGEPEVLQQANRVTIHSPTEGASIGYKIISGPIEPKAWSVYQGPIELPLDHKLKIIAHRIGFLPSRILEYNFK